MKFRCHHCTQLLKIADDQSGRTVACARCQTPLTVPKFVVTFPTPASAASPTETARPTAPVPARATSSPRQRGTAPKPPTRGRIGRGLAKFLLLLLVLAGAGFGYAMMHFNESPPQIWQRLVAAVRQRQNLAPVQARHATPPSPHTRPFFPTPPSLLSR